jgi:hypothetical protein
MDTFNLNMIISQISVELLCICEIILKSQILGLKWNFVFFSKSYNYKTTFFIEGLVYLIPLN